MARLAARRAERRELLADAAEVDHLMGRWRKVCEGAELVHKVDTVSGPTITTPQIVDVTLGPPTRLVVQLLPGMLRDDVVSVGRRLAEGMGAAAIRVDQRGPHYVIIRFLLNDPLTDVVAPLGASRSGPARSVVDSPPIIGVSESGDPVELDLAAGAHLIMQGATGSGKSVGAYSLLAQLATATDVRVAGSDVSGLLLGPWVRRDVNADISTQPIALGTTDPVAHVDTLETLVADMDKRILDLPAGRDAVTVDDDHPLVLAVLEEYPGLLKWIDAVDSKLGKRVRAAVARLLAEGRKAGYRVWIITQRADAAIVGAYERSQASHRLSFRIDTSDGLKMLHPDIAVDTAAEHATAAPGIALLSAPGVPLIRLRAPLLGYADYCRQVDQT